VRGAGRPALLGALTAAVRRGFKASAPRRIIGIMVPEEPDDGDEEEDEDVEFPFPVSREATRLETILDRGYSAMDDGNFEAARGAFREALEIAPESAEPHNYIGLTFLEERNYTGAEMEYAAARMLAAQELGHGFRTVTWWVDPRSRPYLKATLGLALSCLYQERFSQAEQHLNEILRLNPTDNLGCRYVLAELILRRGDAKAAVEAFDGAEIGPGSLYSAALALLDAGDRRGAVLMLRKAFFSNIFIPALLAGERVRTRYRREANNRAAEIDAREYERRCGDLWAPRKSERALVGRVFGDPEVSAESERYVETVDRLSSERDSGARDLILGQLETMRCDETLGKNNAAICERLGL